MTITNITEALDALKDLAEALPAAVTVDDTLSVEGAAADAKAVGDNFNSVAEAIQYVGNNYVTNSAFIPMAETAMAHVNSRSNPHEVTAAQVTTTSGKTVEEALEIPYFDLVAMGLTDLKTTPYQSLQCDAATLAALVEAAKNGVAMFSTTYNGETGDTIMSSVEIIDGLSYLFTHTTSLFCLCIGADLECNDIYIVVRPLSVEAANVRAGTFSGQVVANSTTQTPATMLLRNSKLVTTETNPTVNGEIVWQYG